MFKLVSGMWQIIAIQPDVLGAPQLLNALQGWPDWLPDWLDWLPDFHAWFSLDLLRLSDLLPGIFLDLCGLEYQWRFFMDLSLPIILTLAVLMTWLKPPNSKSWRPSKSFAKPGDRSSLGLDGRTDEIESTRIDETILLRELLQESPDFFLDTHNPSSSCCGSGSCCRTIGLCTRRGHENRIQIQNLRKLCNQLHFEHEVLHEVWQYHRCTTPLPDGENPHPLASTWGVV
eukprot:COSAG02_NODE_17634_length_990_cov_1.049383_2_plen_229_part_01